MKTLFRRLFNKNQAILSKKDGQFYLAPQLAEWVYSFYHLLFSLPLEQNFLSDSLGFLMERFLESSLCQHLKLEPNDFYRHNEAENLIRQDENPGVLWQQICERISSYLEPLTGPLVNTFINEHAWIFQISALKQFPFASFFSLFAAFDLLLNQPPNFQPACLNSKTRKLVSQFFLLVAEIGPLQVAKNQKKIDLVASQGLKLPILEIPDKDIDVLAHNWTKLLDSIPIWDLRRCLANDYYVPRPQLRFCGQVYFHDVKEEFLRSYYSHLQQKFEAGIENGRRRYAEEICRQWMPQFSPAVKFYNNQFDYYGQSHYQLIEAFRCLVPGDEFPFFSHQQQLNLLYNYCQQFLEKQLGGFFERFLRVAFASRLAMYSNGMKIFESVLVIRRSIDHLNNSLMPQSPRGLHLKELRQRIIYANKEAVKEFSTLIAEINQEAVELFTTGHQTLERLQGFIKKLLHTNMRGDLGAQFSQIIPVIDQAVPPLEKLKKVDVSLKDFLYLLKYHQYLKNFQVANTTLTG